MSKTFTVCAFGSTYQISLHAERYSHGGALAVEAVEETEYGPEPFGTITTNIGVAVPGVGPETNLSFVKDWSENAWVNDFLIAHPEIATPTLVVAGLGYVKARLWEFHPENF
jgi:hypothetical protein